MAEPESTQARSAALLLHGLPAATQRQVLVKLDLAERARLSPLLGELAELGLPASLGRSLQHLQSPPPPAAPVLDLPALSAQERVERLNADEVSRCLQLCAPATTAQLLRSNAWPWQANVLARMPPARRVELFSLMHRPAPVLAPQVLDSICEQLHRQASLLRVEPMRGTAVATVGRSAARRRSLRVWIAAHVKRITRWTR